MEVLLVSIVALLLTLINSIGLLVGLMNRPPNTVYLGTIHYFEDYFLYVNHFFQGAHGQWLTANRYTSEATPPSILYWTDVWMGKFGGLFGLSPIVSYHVSLLVITMLTLVVMYVLLTHMFPKSKTHALIGFLFAALSTSFMNHIYVHGNPMWYPFQLWKTPHFALDRLGGVPHQTLQSLLFFLLTILSFSSRNSSRPKIKLVLIGIVAFSLTTVSPIQAIIFLGAFLATQAILYIQKKPVPYKKLLVLSLVTIGTFIYVYFLSTTLPHSQARAWDGQQHTLTTLPFLLLSLGPISVLFLFGILPSLLSGNGFFIFAVILTLGTYSMFLSNIPQWLGISNLRIVFPALYPFMGAIAVNGVLMVAKKLNKIIPPITTIPIVVLLFILISLPTLFWEIDQKIQSQEDTKDQTIYLETPIYDMFTALQTAGRFDDVVLANPKTHMDTLVPALSGHTTYSGHMLLTIRGGEKQTLASQFFALNKPDAENWIQANNIRYILFTPLDGDIKRFTQTYPFLKVYKSFGESAAIFTTFTSSAL